MPDEESPAERQERWQRQQDEQEKADRRRRERLYIDRIRLYHGEWNRRVDFMDKPV